MLSVIAVNFPSVVHLVLLQTMRTCALTYILSPYYQSIFLFVFTSGLSLFFGGQDKRWAHTHTHTHAMKKVSRVKKEDKVSPKRTHT